MRFIDGIDQDVQAPCPALVLLDLNLPKRTGGEVLRYLRQSRRCADVKVLIVSSSDSPKEKAATQELGANGYFRKPPSYEEFLKVGEVILGLLKDDSGK